MSDTYLILTDKTGQFHTEIGTDLIPVEQYDYLLFGIHRARFVIARLQQPTRIALVEETPPYCRNEVPSKFFPTFDTLAGARQDLQQLVRFGAQHTELRRVASPTSENA